MKRSIRLFCAFALGAIGFVGGVLARSGADDPPAVETTTIEGELSDEQRDALYAKLARDVAEIERQQNALKTVIKLVGPTVVHLVAEKTESGDRPSRARTIEESGSGVIVQIDDARYVLTNRHVVKDAAVSAIDVRLADGRKLTPLRKWDDARTDVAVLSLPEVTGGKLVAARLGNSYEVEVGDFVLAVGSPFGLSNSVSFGIVSGAGRRDLLLGDELKIKEFLQTDAAINPGNSGGPLINLRGEVIGINTAIASNSGSNDGVGFSIPINMAMHVARQLVEKGTVVRSFLGVSLDLNFDADKAQKLGIANLHGARISDITPNSPAEKADLQIGDVILKFDGRRVDNDTHLVNLVSMTDVGAEVPLVIVRERKQMELRVTVGNFSDFKAPSDDD